MLRRAYDGVVRALVFAAFSVMLGAALAGTVSRYLPFLPPIAWGEEVTRYAGIWSVFLVSGLGLRHGAHLGVDMLTSRLPGGARRLVYLVVHALILAFVLLLLVAGVRLVRENVGQLSPALEWSMGWIYLCIPIGAGLMLVEALGLLRRALRSLPPPGPPAEDAA
jgi:TRAP-type C4-dicarboxylate transport system permease small subunit